MSEMDDYLADQLSDLSEEAAALAPRHEGDQTPRYQMVRSAILEVTDEIRRRKGLCPPRTEGGRPVSQETIDRLYRRHLETAAQAIDEGALGPARDSLENAAGYAPIPEAVMIAREMVGLRVDVAALMVAYLLEVLG